MHPPTGAVNPPESIQLEVLRGSSRWRATSITAVQNGRRDRATPFDVPNETPHRFARGDAGTDWTPVHALNPSAQKEDTPDTVSHPRGSAWESSRPWLHDDRGETFRPHSRFVRHNETFEDETSRPSASQRYRIAEAFREASLTPDDEPPRSVETFVKSKERFREKEPPRNDRIEHTLAMIGPPPFQALTRPTDTSPANEAAQANAQALFDVLPYVLSTDEPSRYALTALQLAEFDQPHLIPSESTDLFTSTARSQPIIAFEKLAADRTTSISLPEPTGAMLLGAGSLPMLRRQSRSR
jgi:hypothetical protein